MPSLKTLDIILQNLESVTSDPQGIACEDHPLLPEENNRAIALAETVLHNNDPDDELKDTCSWAYISAGLHLIDLSKQEGNNPSDCLEKALNFVQRALEINPDRYEAFNAWGTGLQCLARFAQEEQTSPFTFPVLKRGKPSLMISFLL
jgi:hypothetical protein